MQKICIIIPCYNEASRLNLDEFQKFIDSNQTIDLLFSNDGSTDGTMTMLQKFESGNAGRVSVFDAKINSGKAEAVRLGFNEAFSKKKYEFVGFWDADLATPLSEVKYFLNYPDKDIILGSRWKRMGASIERKAGRHILGRIFSTFASIILKLPVYDTQCGAKLFSKHTEPIFREKFITRWLFDIELIARYRNSSGIQRTHEKIIEMPLHQWIEKGGSKIRLKHMLKVPFELISIYNKYN